MNAANQAKVERFWQRMTEAVGVIPIRVIGLLDLLQLSASEGLATNKDWGAQVLEDIVNDGEAIFEEACQRELVNRDNKYAIFGRHENDLNNFRLTGSEMSSINAIAKMVQRYGILHFIGEMEVGPGRLQAPRPVRPAAAVNGTPVPVEIKTALIKRLSEYYKKHRECNVRPNVFDNIPMHIDSQDAEEMKIKVKCVRCSQTIKCTKKREKFIISNYTQHVRNIHRTRQISCASPRLSRDDRLRARQDRVNRGQGEDDGFVTTDVTVVNSGDACEDSEVHNDLPEGTVEDNGGECDGRTESVEERDTVANADTPAMTATEQPRDDRVGRIEEGDAEVVVVDNPARDCSKQPRRRVVSTARVDLTDPGEGCSRINSGN